MKKKLSLIIYLFVLSILLCEKYFDGIKNKYNRTVVYFNINHEQQLQILIINI